MQASVTTCIDEYRKYEASTAVLFALSRLITDNPKVGRLYGVTKDIRTKNNKITPDVSASCENDTAALLLELKWSLTPETAKDEILKLKRYCEASFSWNKADVKKTDVVLVVAQEDADTTIKAIEELIRQGNTFLNTGVSVWKWYFARPRGNARNSSGNESMWLEKVWGSTRNINLELIMNSASGYQIPNDILRFMRYTYRFTKDKPPVQYTAGMLLLHVLSAFRTRSDKREALRITTDLTDTVYERAKSFFPVRDPSSETVQVRKQWIREALAALIRATIKEIKVPFQTRGSLDEYICRMLAKIPKPRGRPPGVGRGRRKPRLSPYDTKLI